MPVVDIPGVGTVDFPEEMGEADISKAADEVYSQWEIDDTRRRAAEAPMQRRQALGRELNAERAVGAFAEARAQEADRTAREISPLAATAENPYGLFGSVARDLVGPVLNRAGDVAAGVARDVLTGEVTGRAPFPATAFALAGNKVENFNGGRPPGGVLGQGLEDAARMLPTIAAGTALASAGVPAPIAFGGTMAAGTFAETQDPIAAARSGMTGALIPGVAGLAKEAAAGVLGKAVSAGLLKSGANTTQKVVEMLASQGAIQVFLEGLNVPEYVQMSPEERKAAIIRNLAANVAFLAMDLPGVVHRGVPSETARRPEVAARNQAATVGEAVMELVNDPAGIDALQRAADDVALRLTDPRLGEPGAFPPLRAPAPRNDIEPGRPAEIQVPPAEVLSPEPKVEAAPVDLPVGEVVEAPPPAAPVARSGIEPGRPAEIQVPPAEVLSPEPKVEAAPVDLPVGAAPKEEAAPAPPEIAPAQAVAQMHQVTPYKDGNVLVQGYDHARRRKDGSEPFTATINYNMPGEKTVSAKNPQELEKKLGIKILGLPGPDPAARVAIQDQAKAKWEAAKAEGKANEPARLRDEIAALEAKRKASVDKPRKTPTAVQKGRLEANRLADQIDKLQARLAEIDPKVEAPAPVEPAKPEVPPVDQMLKVPESASVEESRARIKGVEQSTASLREELLSVEEQLRRVSQVIHPSRGNAYQRSQIKKSAKRRDVDEFRSWTKRRDQILSAISVIEETVKKDRAVVDADVDAKVINDPSQPRLRRLDRLVRYLQDQKAPLPPELVAAHQAEAEAAILRAVPDVTAPEMAKLRDELLRESYFGTKEESIAEKLQRLVHDLRKAQLDALVNTPGDVALHVVPEDLRAEVEAVRRHSPRMAKKFEPVGSAKIQELKSRLVEETAKWRQEEAARQEASASAAAEERAKEGKLLAEAQDVVASAKRTGSKGGRSPKEVREELAQRIFDEAVALVKGVTLRTGRESGELVAEGAYLAKGTITQKDTGRFEVVAGRIGGGEETIRATVDSLEAAQNLIRALAGSGEGRAIIAVPGDGVYRLRKDGKSLLNLWVKARRLAVGSQHPGVAGSFKSGGAEAPPGSIRTAQDWADAKEFHGLAPGDTIASWSPALADVAQKLNPGNPEAVTVADMDSFVAEKSGKKKPAPEAPAAPGVDAGNLGPVGMGGAKPTEFAPTGTPTSIKNATVDAERAKRGLPPAMEPSRRAFGEVWDEAMAMVDRDPAVQDVLIAELAKAPRALTDLEDALLLHRQIDLQNEYNRHARELATAYDDSRQFPDRLESVERHKALLQDASNRLQELYDVGKAAGTATARGLNARKMLAKEDFTLEKMEMELRAANEGRPLSDVERQRLQAAHDRIAELQAKLDAQAREMELARAQRAADATVSEMNRQAAKDPAYSPQVLAMAERIVGKLETAAVAAKARLMGRLGNTSAGVDPTILADVAVIGAAKIARGALEFARWSEQMLHEFGEAVRPYLEPGFAAAKAHHDREISKAAGQDAEQVRRAIRKDDVEGQRKAIVEGMAEAGADADLGYYVRRLALNFVRSGVTDREALVSAVHGELVKVFPDMTRRQAMDAISGYGDFKPLDPNAAKATLRDIRGQLQQLAKLEDIVARRPALKSGVERRTPTDEERRLIAQVNDAKRRYGVVSSDPSRQLRGALDAVKTRLRNQIKDLGYQISTGTRIVRNKVEVAMDAEAEILKAQRAALKAQFDAMFARPGMTDAQRVAIAEKAIERSIAEYETRIAARDVAPMRKMPRDLRSARLDALKARRDALRAELDALRRAMTPAPTNDALLADLKARMMTRLAEYQDRIARGDFVPPVRREVTLDNAALRLKAELEMAKASWKRGVELAALRSRSLPHRFAGGVREAFNLPREILSSGDVSAVLRQGGFITMGHPLRAASSIGPMFRALVSERAAAEIDVQIRDRVNAPLYHRAKLFLAPLDTTRLTSMEEAYMSQFGKRIPGVRASGRAYVTFLNKLRADSFDAMVDRLQRNGPTLNDLELRAVANYINVATGRGDMGKAAAAAETLATVFFSPRLVASRFQIVLGQPLLRGESRRVRMAIAADYARFLGGIAVVYGLGSLAGAEVEWDPRSSDFGKLRFGNTRVDMLGGLSQVTVLLSRLGTGEIKSLSGKVRSLRAAGFGQESAAGVLGRFLRSKLAPVPGLVLDALSGENVVGEPVTAGAVAQRAVVPLSFQDIYEVMAKDGIEKGVAVGILSLFGAGLQQFEPKKKEPAK